MDLTWGQVATDFTVSGSISTICYGATTFIGASAGTAIAGPVAGVVMGGLASAYVGPRCYKWTRDKTVELAYDRPTDPETEQSGHLFGMVVGSIGGFHFGARFGQAIRWSLQYPNYATYEAKTRALTGQTYNANRQAIDPNGLRGPANHLDHKVSVRQGYEMRIPPAVIAAPQNLRIIPAPQNLSEGARLSPAVMRPAVCVWGVLNWTRWCGGAVVQ